jgi:hypothetical protein
MATVVDDMAAPCGWPCYPGSHPDVDVGELDPSRVSVRPFGKDTCKEGLEHHLDTFEVENDQDDRFVVCATQVE